MDDIWDEQVLEKPNWNDHVQHFFASGDINCMANEAIDLATYYGARLNADRIYFHTKRGSMPPQADRRWSETKVLNFYNWMKAGYPEKEEHHHLFTIKAPTEQRVRRSLKEYENDTDALDQLKKAFSGMMAKPIDDPDGYYRLAGIHWLPAPAMYCRHHENAYNPWHRAYLIAFEDAMRKIEGCEDITLPYWDIQENHIPDFIWEEPFSHYEFQTEVIDHRDVYLAHPGDRTERRNKVQLLDLIKDYKDSSNGLTIDGYIRKAISADSWQKFNGWRGTTLPQHEGIIRAHDLGHGLCGTTSQPLKPNLSLATPNFASFDPLFWFFHCNWDRLWWKWQVEVDATELSRFKTLAFSKDDPTDWIDDPVTSMLQPFNVYTKDMIDSNGLNIDYTIADSDFAVEINSSSNGSALANDNPMVLDTTSLSVRVKGINRLAIPGSFYIELIAGYETIGNTFIFQSDVPQLCRSCTKTGLFSVDFLVSAEEVDGKNLSVKVTCQANDGPIVMSDEDYGSPSINLRVLMN